VDARWPIEGGRWALLQAATAPTAPSSALPGTAMPLPESLRVCCCNEPAVVVVLAASQVLRAFTLEGMKGCVAVCWPVAGLLLASHPTAALWLHAEGHSLLAALLRAGRAVGWGCEQRYWQWYRQRSLLGGACLFPLPATHCPSPIPGQGSRPGSP